MVTLFLMDFTAFPARITVSKLPILVLPWGQPLKLSNRIQELSDLIAAEFSNNPDGTLRNNSGKIPGWNGIYASVKIQISDEHRITMYVSPVRVSDDLAAQHYHGRTEGSQINNPIHPLGGYVMPVIVDRSDLVLLLETRPHDAFLDAGKLNVPGASFPHSAVGDAYAQMASTMRHKTGIAMQAVAHVGVINDLANSIKLITAYATVNERSIPAGCKLVEVPASDFAGFARRHDPMEEWQLSGFFAACQILSAAGSSGLGRDPGHYAELGNSLLEQQNERLKESPLSVMTTLQKLGMDL